MALCHILCHIKIGIHQSSKKRELKINPNEWLELLEENRNLMGGGSDRAISLIAEARQVGLLDEKVQIDYQNYQEMFSILQATMNWTPNNVVHSDGMDRLTFLQSRLQEMRDEFSEIGITRITRI